MPVENETEQDDRGSVYMDEKTGLVVYRSSALGGCIKGLVAARKGLTPLPWSDDTLRRFADGHLHEASILREVEKQGYIISGQQRTIEIPIMPGIVVRGHIDGLATDGIETWVVDAKAVSKDSYEKFAKMGIDAYPQYKYQLSTYSLALGLPGMLAFKDKNSGKVLIKVYPISVLYTRLDILRRVHAIETGAKKQIGLTPCDPDAMRWGCPWRYYHDETDARVSIWDNKEKVDADVTSRLADLAEEYDVARANEKAEKKRKDELGQQIIEELMSLDLTAAETDDFTIKYGYRHKPGKLNKEAIAERLGVPNLDRFWVDGELSDEPTPTITRKKRK